MDQFRHNGSYEGFLMTDCRKLGTGIWFVEELESNHSSKPKNLSYVH